MKQKRKILELLYSSREFMVRYEEDLQNTCTKDSVDALNVFGAFSEVHIDQINRLIDLVLDCKICKR